MDRAFINGLDRIINYQMEGDILVHYWIIMLALCAL